MMECNICNELNKVFENIQSEYIDLVKSDKNIIFSTNELVVLPSFGPLNNSHTMIVPREHVNSFACLSEKTRDKTRLLINILQESFYKEYKRSLIFFESGAGKITNYSGGCIVHAHIHCVLENSEFERDLFQEVELEKLPVTDRSKFDKNLGYIWYKSADGNEYLKNNPLLPSQFLRYLYMQNSEKPLRWNWRRDIDIDSIKKVINTYSKIFI